MQKSQKVYEFQKNSQEKVIIRFSEYRGTKTIDIRAFYQGIGNPNEWKPSRKGICISEDLIDELIKG